MSKTMKVRKSGNSLIMTIPRDIADLFNIQEGKELEIEAMGSDSFRVKVK